MNNLFYDTETCGLHGMCVLLQYQVEGTDEINLFSPWTERVKDTLELIEWMMTLNHIGFNLAYDQFHLSKLYTIWRLLPPDIIPEDHINLVASMEPLGRDGPCLKPPAACDLMLIGRQTAFQRTMNRKDIKIKKIHYSVAFEVRDFLEKYIQLDDILHANRKNKFAPKWGVFDSDGGDGWEWKDIVLKFKPSGSLKVIAEYALGEQTTAYGDLPTPEQPIELGYAPFALAISNAERGWKGKVQVRGGLRRGYTWPAIIHNHISFWLNNSIARKYATNDVIYTRKLWEYLGKPEPGDDDSELACMVGANRWRGYAIDTTKINAVIKKIEVDANSAPKAPNAVRSWLTEAMNEEEKLIYDVTADGSTKKTVLEELSLWSGSVGVRAKACLDARQAKYKLDVLNKIKLAGRFHVAAEVIGTLSGRKSGRGGDLNSQGIGREQSIRECFNLALPGHILCGGDFESFEVVLALAVYNDPKLEAAVRSGKKIHALFGQHVYPNMTYDEIIRDKEKYTRSKSAVFAMIYGGEAYTLKERLGVPIEDAEKAYNNFAKEYPGVAKGRQRVNEMFCSMRQPNGIGTRVYWHEPADRISTLFGFNRYFTIENQICKALFTLANKPQREWGNNNNGVVVRRDREQTVLGATQSALYAAAFALQAANTRAAGNHVIQGSGAHITKHLERRIWDLQPSGINDWVVQPFNEHDEVIVTCVPSVVEQIHSVVDGVVDSFKSKVPLISIDWHDSMNSWADK
jgi:hypothetical protein